PEFINTVYKEALWNSRQVWAARGSEGHPVPPLAWQGHLQAPVSSLGPCQVLIQAPEKRRNSSVHALTAPQCSDSALFTPDLAPQSQQFPFLSRKFYKVYGNGPKPFDLTQLNFKSTCQRFVEKYNELKEEGKIEEEKLFEETGKALLASGILLQRRGVDKGAAPRDAASQPQLQAVLGELQDKRKDGQEQPPELAGTQKESPCPS
uniref:Mitochondrial ribosomal protein S23 n=1 Tax=Zonotrichia albicollis TaxID=44394 RepID=A0A8D2MZ57_ZONAL